MRVSFRDSTKSTSGANNINNGSVPFMCPSGTSQWASMRDTGALTLPHRNGTEPGSFWSCGSPALTCQNVWYEKGLSTNLNLKFRAWNKRTLRGSALRLFHAVLIKFQHFISAGTIPCGFHSPAALNLCRQQWITSPHFKLHCNSDNRWHFLPKS